MFAWGFIVLFAAYAVYLAYTADSSGKSVMQTGDILTGLFLYFFSNLSYIFIVYASIKLFGGEGNLNKVKALFAGLLIVLAVDAVSFPHCLPMNSMPQDAGSYLCSDTLYSQILGGLGQGTAWFMVYIMFPVLFMILALVILGHIQFTNKIKKFGN